MEPAAGNRPPETGSWEPTAGGRSRETGAVGSRVHVAGSRGPRTRDREPMPGGRKPKTPEGGEPEPKAGDVALLVSDIVTINQCLRP